MKTTRKSCDRCNVMKRKCDRLHPCRCVIHYSSSTFWLVEMFVRSRLARVSCHCRLQAAVTGICLALAPRHSLPFGKVVLHLHPRSHSSGLILLIWSPRVPSRLRPIHSISWWCMRYTALGAALCGARHVYTACGDREIAVRPTESEHRAYRARTSQNQAPWRPEDIANRQGWRSKGTLFRGTPCR